MTEAEWLAAKHPNPLLDSEHCYSSRKCLLFGCACARRVLHFLTDSRFAEALNASERQIDEPMHRISLRRLAAEAQGDLSGRSVHTRERRAAAAVFWACDEHSEDYIQAAEQSRFAVGANANAAHHFATTVEEVIQAGIVRDLFGNPFRPITFAPEWRTDTVTAVAREMYASRDFSSMAILADALQDADCDNDDILNHCRDAQQVHVRGCWVVDLVLGMR